MSPVIKIENLYKEYRLGTIGYGTLREDMVSWWAKIKGRPDPNSIIGQSNGKIISSTDHILALNNINLEVKQGERLGIIGKNGAGKTTLLKILAQIASPTHGRVMAKGKIASLIAVGTGFHSELTGRENVYLNGSILGLTKKEIDNRFNEIVEFSGVEKFIDTPVKRYSSGMSVRLGFAVAAHLDPDILVVDEVLAVGDAEFRKKALEKMKPDGISESKTILFVSHNMQAIKQLCDRCILLENGNLINDGSPDEVISYYLKGDSNNELISYNDNFTHLNNNDYVSINSVRLIDKNNNEIKEVENNQTIGVEINYDIKKNKLILPSVNVYNNFGEVLFSSIDRILNKAEARKLGQHKCIMWFPNYFFSEGLFSVAITLFIPSPITSERLIETEQILRFKIIDRDLNELIGFKSEDRPTSLRPQFEWTYEKT